MPESFRTDAAKCGMIGSVMTEKKHSPYFGPLMMLAASVLFSTGGILCKLIPWSPLAINGVRNLLGGLLIGAYLLITHHKLKFNLKVLFGAICMCGVTTLFIVANKLTTAANAIVLQYSAPVWIILLSALLLHKKPVRRDVITILVVIIGIIFFFLDGIGSGSLAGDGAAVAAGIFYAGLFLLNSLPGADALSSLFFGQLGTGILLSPLVFRETDFSAVPLIAVTVLGIFQVGLAYIFFNLATKYTAPVTAAIIAGVEPVLNSLLVAIFWGELLTPLSLAGAVIVIAAILIYNILNARKPVS